MLPIQKMFLTNHNRPGLKIRKLKGVVVHWTANTNKGANALANRNYFNSTNNAVSAHYIVDDGNIVQCVPDDEIAYHVGATKYTSIGESIREKPYSPNYYLIGIEMCVNFDGNWDKTYQNTVELVASLLKKHKFTIDDLYRHYDITGKDCPKMMINATDWLKFRRRVIEEMEEDKNQEVSSWAKDAYLWVKEKGISDGTRPKEPITREEVWTMLYRMKG